MASNSFIGNAPLIKQVTSWTFGGTWLATETVTFTIGTKAVSCLTGSTAIATILANLTTFFATLDATIYPEFTGDIVVSNDAATKLLATATNAGTPFTMALSTNSGSGTIGSATVVTANSGPDDASVAANYSTGSLPASSDDLTIGLAGTSIRYGLSQSAIVLNSLTVIGPMTAGLPPVNSSGYYEYRPTYWAIAAATITFQPAVGNGSCLFQLDPGNHTTTVNVFGMGTPTGTYALALKGAAASYTLNLQQGVIGVAVNTGETATVPTLRVGYENNVSSDVTLTLGSGVTLTTVTQFGGSVTAASAVTTWTVSAGSGVQTGAATITTLTVFPAAQQTGTFSYQSTGTLTTLTLGPRSTFDAQTVGLGRTVTNCTVYSGATILDGERSITFANPPAFKCDPYSECTIVRGSNVSLAI